MAGLYGSERTPEVVGSPLKGPREPHRA